MLSCESIREWVFSAYDNAYLFSKSAGHTEDFSRRLATYHIIQDLLSETSQQKIDEAFLSEECMPFNSLEPAAAKSIISEYLVWKFFPDEAQLDVLKPHMKFYKDFLFAKAEEIGEKGADHFLFSAIYCEKHDWQRYIAAMPLK